MALSRVKGGGGVKCWILRQVYGLFLQKSNAKIFNNKPIQIKIEIDKNILHEISLRGHSLIT